MQLVRILVLACAAMLASPSAAAAQMVPASSSWSPPPAPSTPPYSWSASSGASIIGTDSATASRRIVGLRGAVIGAFAGMGFGLFMVRATCDAQDCDSHPDTRKIMIGSTIVGAVGGFLIDHVWHGMRGGPRRDEGRARPFVRRPGGGRTLSAAR